MNVNIAPRGHSTKAVTAYLLNPKRDDPHALPRVGNTETFNVYTDDVEKAAGWMAWVDGNRALIQQRNGGDGRGRPATAGNVYHMSISWRPDDQPSWEHMRETALAAMQERGLAEHQFYMVEHTDEPHKHVHIVANLVHPETGKINNCYKDRDVLDSWANEYEKVHGIQCENRAAKYEAWEQDRAAFPDRTAKRNHSEAVTTAFERSDSGQAFQAALAEEGLTLARGKRRAFVVVDQNGDIANLTKCIEFTDGTKGRAKTVKIREHLSDVAPDDLRDADSVAEQAVARMERGADGEEDGGGDDGQAVADGLASASKKHREESSEEVPDTTLEDQAKAHKAAFLKASKSKADEQRKAAEAAKAEAKALEEKKRQEQAAALAQEQRKQQQQRRWEEFQESLPHRTAESRKKWQIDELTLQREEAQSRVDGLSSFWSRVFKPFQRREALDHLNNASLQLEERTARFEADVQAFKRDEPLRGAVPETQTSDHPAPSQFQPGLSAQQRRSAEKEAFLLRQEETRQQRRSEPEQKPDLDRE